ncbi:mas-related G-protein coupled receptor member H-like [Heteronotia binoei]|uniref:mas-related G-protein coupled receptor member H-like n=1 Tax=Heteronotia binoei TaxID=13085 RepID=UPI00292E3DB5|nr:mas-related G-protein coupled receptor member H-like [Heteronotia binoei]
MTDFSKTSPSPAEDGPQDADMYNNTWLSSHNTSSGSPEQNFNSVRIIYIFILCICIIGLVRNGIVVCLLGFDIKRSPFTTYILNLAVADFGVSLSFDLALILIQAHTESVLAIAIVLHFVVFMYTVSQLLLTAISIDRCVSVLFPIWYRCHRPRHFSTVVCTVIWVLSFLFSGSSVTIDLLEHFGAYWMHYSSYIAGSVVFFPLVTISTMILFFKMYCTSQQPRRGRVLTIVLITLLFYLLFAFPTNTIYTVNYFFGYKYDYLAVYGALCSCLNSCINPVIYFLVGRRKRSQGRQSPTLLLQRAFQEEEERREEHGTTDQTSL